MRTSPELWRKPPKADFPGSRNPAPPKRPCCAGPGSGDRRFRRRRRIFLLGEAVGDLVIIALVGGEDMLAETRVRRRVERAHGDRDPVPMGWVPEQDRAADRAETASD